LLCDAFLHAKQACTFSWKSGVAGALIGKAGMDSRKRENLNILKRVGLEERVHIHKRLIRPATAVHLRCVAQDEFEPIRDPHQPMELSRGTSPLQKEWAHMEAPLLQGA